MPRLDHYEVWISVDGKKLPEYGIHHHSEADPTEITCWIPSQAGKVCQYFWLVSVSDSSEFYV